MQPQENNTTISIVTPVYFSDMSTKAMSDENLLHARGTTYYKPLEWIIVETGSTYYHKDADIYIYERNRTLPDISCDRGFRNASGKFVVFLANDVRVCDNWIEKMLECFKHHPDCGLASLGNNEHNDEERDEIVEGMYFSVCMMRKEDAWFDLSYPYNFADTDLVFRLHLKGLKCYKNLSGLIYHKKHATCGMFGGNLEGYKRSREHFISKYKKYSEDPLFKVLAGVRG